MPTRPFDRGWLRGSPRDMPVATSIPADSLIPFVADVSTSPKYKTISPRDIQGGVYNVKSYGAVGDGVTDDTAAISAAIVAGRLTGAVYLPAGIYLVTSTLATLFGSATLYGDGRRKTFILFNPTADDVCMVVNEGAAQSTHVTLRGFSVKSTDTTYTKVALDVYDLGTCVLDDIYVWGTGNTAGPGTGAYWTGGTGSIALRTNGRDATQVSNFEAVADRPVYIAANPNATASEGEDIDHWSFNNLYLVGNDYPLIEVASGRGVMEMEFGGYQAWVGGSAGFKINDTRVAPTVPSRGLKFKNVRWEQATVSTGYMFDLTFTEQIQTLLIQNCLASSAARGIYLNGFKRAVLDGFVAAQTSANTSLLTAGVTADSVLVMRGCIWDPGGTVTTTGLTLLSAEAYRSASYAAPSDAVYAGQIVDSLINVAKGTFTGPNTTEVLAVVGVTGDSLQVVPQAAGSGAALRTMNNARSDFEPMNLTFETLDLRYRTGAGTSASAATVDANGQLGLVKRFFPSTDALAAQTACGLFAGTGAPNNANGQNGDIYLRSDGGALTTVYHKRAGAWVGVV